MSTEQESSHPSGEFRKMRRGKQEISREECVEVLEQAPRGILALHGENGYPYAIPVNQYFCAEEGRLYFHCAKQGLKLDLLARDAKACFTVMDQGFLREGEWALNIRSVVCLGRLSVVEDPTRVRQVCLDLARKFYPSEEAAQAELGAAARVCVLALDIERMTGKLVNES